MQPNFLIIFLAALVPIIVSFIWYNPKVMSAGWMKHTGLADAELKKANMPLVFFLTLLFSFMLSMAMMSIVIHQFHLYSIIQSEPHAFEKGSAANNDVVAFMDKYGHNFRTFKHGAFHGTIASLFIALPIIGINALYARKSAKYVLIHVGYWAISMALMGGIICQFM
ncbi:MAG: DUF1761 domain-containing protein [Sphingobacteriales bacterium]|nr:MAG: DUF1761 domain-containing protein [Sphingobacteriales bacterium]